MVYCVCAYGVKNSDYQVKNSPISTESQFAKFNARQFSRYTVVGYDDSAICYNLVTF